MSKFLDARKVRVAERVSASQKLARKDAEALLARLFRASLCSACPFHHRAAHDGLWRESVLRGRKAADSAIRDAFCQPGETLVGWMDVKPPSETPRPRETDNPDAIMRRWQPPAKRELDYPRRRFAA